MGREESEEVRRVDSRARRRDYESPNLAGRYSGVAQVLKRGVWT